MPHQPDFLGKHQDPAKRRFFFFLKFFFGFIMVGVLLAIFTSESVVRESLILEGISQVPAVRRVRQLIHSNDRSLAGARDNRTNILLLGMGGVKHEGPFLTDTIILASIEHKKGETALVSVPRDLAVPIPGMGWYKINSANAYGEQRESGQGPELAREVLAEILDLPIHYYIRVDFDGFVTLIDRLGGIEVYVERSFIDPTYPTGENGEVRSLEFEAGWQKMNGKRTLEFARSRHGSNGEGSDFARARRQQKILMALGQKIFSRGILRSPAKISAIVETIGSHVRTNLSPWELLAMGRQALSLDPEKIKTLVLDDSPNGLLAPTIGVDGAYLLIPKNSDWSLVREAVKDIFEEEAMALVETPKDPARLEIQNGTLITGLAARAADLLEREGFSVIKVGNARERERTRTVIYDLTDGRYANKLLRLRELLDADVSLSVPGWLLAPEIVPQELRLTDLPSANAADHPDFLIILGSD